MKTNICKEFNYFETLLEGLKLFSFRPTNYEFSSFIILQSLVEKKLIESKQRNTIRTIFSESLIQEITKLLRGNSFEDIINYKYTTITEYLNTRPLYENNDIICELQPIKSRNCFLLPLYALGRKLSYQDATYHLADYFRISYNKNRCFDVVSEHDKKTSQELNEEYLFKDENNMDVCVFEVQNINNQHVLLPKPDRKNNNLYILPDCIPLFNLPTLKYNPSATVILTEDLSLAKNMQNFQAKNFLRNKFVNQNKFWHQEYEEYINFFKNYTKINNRSLKISGYNRMLENIQKIELGTKSMCDFFSELNLAWENLGETYLKNDIVFVGTYNVFNSLDLIDFAPLRNRNIIFFLNGDMKKVDRYRKFLSIYEKVISIDEKPRIKFLHVPASINNLNIEANEIEFLKAEELLLQAHKLGIDIPINLMKKLETDLRKCRKNKNNNFLIEPILGKRALNLIIGERGSGKSWLAHLLAYSLASGKTIIKKWKIVKPVKVLYINGELDKELLDSRDSIIRKIFPKNKKNENAIFKTVKDLNLLEESDRNKIESFITEASLTKGNPEKTVSVLILDNLMFLSDNGSDKKRWTEIRKWISLLKENRNISVILIHHSRSKELRSFGSSHIENSADDVIHLSKVINDKCLEVTVTETKNRRSLESQPFNIQLFLGRKPFCFVPDDEKLIKYNWKMPLPDKIDKIRELRGENKKWQEIADLFGMSKITVEKFAGLYRTEISGDK